ncbi:MAG: hypothetical protein Kow0089_08610 [Desulfobulbaceae bacterium]
MTDPIFIETIRRNCDISDARDNGIYSICSLVLKLRNLYKWEHGLEPWQEPESAELLDWIEQRESWWEEISGEEYRPLSLNGCETDPFDQEEINALLGDNDLLYGAGYGRSLKSIFFLAEKIREDTAAGCPVVILGRERARELSSPFAMLQDGSIIIRRYSLRFFFWDHIQEIRSSCKASLHHALKRYGILRDGQLDQDLFRERLDLIVDEEIPIFIHHEVGEQKQHTFDSDTLRRIVSTYPDSVIEYVSRAVKDVLADTHPEGMISYIIGERRDASLGLYVGLLAGLRRVLFPQIGEAFEEFLRNGDWRVIEQARQSCRDNSLRLAEKIRALAADLGGGDDEQVKMRFHDEVLRPLGLEIPEPE